MYIILKYVRQTLDILKLALRVPVSFKVSMLCYMVN